MSETNGTAGTTYSDQRDMSDIDLPLTLSSRGRYGDGEVLVRGQTGFVVNGVERAAIQDGAQDVCCAVTRTGYTRGEADHNSDLF